MKQQILYITLALATAILTSCVDAEERDNSVRGNFEALWKTVDEHYCFLNEKQAEYGLDWDEVYTRYSTRVDKIQNNIQLFDMLADMLAELRDGHTNLVSKFDISRYNQWYDAYPRNLSDSIRQKYLGKKYRAVSGIKYTILQPENIAYLVVESFMSPISDGSLDNILHILKDCPAMIIDVRSNGGGMITSAERLASRFAEKKIKVGYLRHKTGRGRNDFSKPEPIYVTPPAHHLTWQKPVAVLTNRRCYSATNDFVNKMKHIPTAIIIGDRTGGGAGLPFTSEIPNGWTVRFSACPTTDENGHELESGIDPDIKVDISSKDYQEGRDTIIDAAKVLLAQRQFHRLQSLPSGTPPGAPR